MGRRSLLQTAAGANMWVVSNLIFLKFLLIVVLCYLLYLSYPENIFDKGGTTNMQGFNTFL